jgi:hypothetical protein
MAKFAQGKICHGSGGRADVLAQLRLDEDDHRPRAGALPVPVIGSSHAASIAEKSKRRQAD